MARMLPPVLIPGQDGRIPPGERLLFEKLRDAPGTESWRVFHSVYFADHVTQRSGEADFVVVIPKKGIVVLEVKSQGPNADVRRDPDGTWQLGSIRSVKGPFRQAAENAETLRRRLGETERLRDIVVTSAVWFTHRDFTGAVSGEEWFDWQALDRRHHIRQPAAKSLETVIDRARGHLSSRGRGWLVALETPDADMTREITNYLRPAFELGIDRSLQRSTIQADLVRFTSEQYAALDLLSGQPRAEILGAAGTGKTFLALERARRLALSGKKVFLCCFNRALGDFLSDAVQDLPSVVACNLHRELTRLADVSWQQSEDFASEELPLLVAEKLLEESEAHYDALVIDEAQDVMTDAYLDCLDLLVHGGLASGNVTIFGDRQRQAIYASSARDIWRERMPDLPPAFTLGINCRNAPELEGALQVWSDLADDAYVSFRRPPGEQLPPRQYFVNPGSEGEKLSKVFEELRGPGAAYSADDVVVLSPSRRPRAVEELPESDPWKRRISPVRGPGKVWSTTIHAFKGLEAPVVVLVDIEDVQSDRGKSLLYIGMTRAVERLIVLAAPWVAEDLKRRVGGA